MKTAEEVAEEIVSELHSRFPGLTEWFRDVCGQRITSALIARDKENEERIKAHEYAYKLAEERIEFQLKRNKECDERIAQLEAALRDAKPYVQDVWDETKGTSREGTAMGAAHTLNVIESLLSHSRKD